jgi:hypothetical protein
MMPKRTDPAEMGTAQCKQGNHARKPNKGNYARKWNTT